MLGQFSPPVTGESTCNEAVEAILKHNKFDTQVINTSLITDVSNVGKFQWNKLLTLAKIYIHFLTFIFKSQQIYITPGQTTFGLLRAIPFILVGKIFRKQIISHWHGYGIIPLLRTHKRMTTFVLSNARNVFLTTNLKLIISQLGHSAAQDQVIPNFVNIKNGAKTEVQTTRLTVLYLGSLMKEKGYQEFIDAARALGAVDFHICGTGSLDDVEIVKSATLELKNLYYHGLVRGEIKHQVFLDADVFVLQTKYTTEGVPLALLEAMASSCAIITTQHNGIPETVGDTALFVNKEDANDLINKIQILESDKAKLKALQERALIRSKAFSLSAFESNILELFRHETHKR